MYKYICKHTFTNIHIITQGYMYTPTCTCRCTRTLHILYTCTYNMHTCTYIDVYN